jgi:hypothetical protein
MANGLRTDGQRGNLAVLEREVVTELRRAARKIAADLGGRDGLLAHGREVSDGRLRLVFRDGSIHPFLDGRAAVFVCFVADDGVVGKEGIEIMGLPAVVRLKKRGDDCWQFWIHKFVRQKVGSSRLNSKQQQSECAGTYHFSQNHGLLLKPMTFAEF